MPRVNREYDWMDPVPDEQMGSANSSLVVAFDLTEDEREEMRREQRERAKRKRPAGFAPPGMKPPKTLPRRRRRR